MWTRFPIFFELLSPLHVGFLPSALGTVVAPTRLYVPGKSVWAAVVASLTGRLVRVPGPQDFDEIGDALGECAAFSYLYLSNGQRLFTPSYEQGEQQWDGEDDHNFRAAYIDSRMSTQIGRSGSAEDGSLHEIEYVRHRTGGSGTPVGPVFLCGAGWFKQDCEIRGMRVHLDGDTVCLGTGEESRGLLEEVSLGGERNYGFGRVRSALIPESLRQRLQACWPVAPGTPFEPTTPLLGHSTYRADLLFKGEIETLAGRAYLRHSAASFESPGSALSNSGPCFAPGTVIKGLGVQFSVDAIGRFTIKRPYGENGLDLHTRVS